MSCQTRLAMLPTISNSQYFKFHSTCFLRRTVFLLPCNKNRSRISSNAGKSLRRMLLVKHGTKCDLENLVVILTWSTSEKVWRRGTVKRTGIVILAEQFNVSQSIVPVVRILKVGRWVPHELTKRQQENRRKICEILLARLKQRNFFIESLLVQKNRVWA